MNTETKSKVCCAACHKPYIKWRTRETDTNYALNWKATCLNSRACWETTPEGAKVYIYD